MFDRLFKRGETAIMHVWSSKLDVAQRGHGEFGFVAIFSSDQKTAKISGFGIQPVICKALTLEKWPAMAMKTISAKLLAARIVFRMKQFKTALLFSRELRCPPEHEIEFCMKGGLSQKKLFECASDAVGRDFRSAKCASKKRRVDALITTNFRHDIGDRLVHFDGVLDRLQDLLAKRCSAAVPEERCFPCKVKKRHGIARAGRALRARAGHFVLRKRCLRQMAGSTALRIVDRKQRIKEQAPA